MKYILFLMLVSCVSSPPKIPDQIRPLPEPPEWAVCHTQVSNRGRIPSNFINELVAWARTSPDEIWTENANQDAYSLMAPKLAPYTSLQYRKASLINALLVHAGIESSWNHNTGIDSSKSSNLNTCAAAEAGAYQPSYDSVNSFGGDLKILFNNSCSSYSGEACIRFQKCAKENHSFSAEYTARLLRHRNGYKHFGPWIRGEVSKYITKACVLEIESHL